MNAAVTVRGPIEPDRLTNWLSDHSITVRTSANGDETMIHGLGLDLALDVSDADDADPTWWVASVLRRRLRTVADVDDCLSPGLVNVLTEGTWTHPHAGPEPADLRGVLLVKPGTRVSADALSDIGRRLAECGYRAERARFAGADEIRRHELAVRHHGPHAELAARGRMTPVERLAFLTLYDKPDFVEHFGAHPLDVDVLPAWRVIEELGVPEPALTQWSMRDTARRGLDSGAVDGPNGIGECLYVNVFQHPDYHGGRPFAALNPHMPGVLGEFHGANGAIALQISAVSDAALPWPRMRKEFCGSTEPRDALPGSVRGDAFAGILDLSGVDGQPVRRVNNGVHLSNGAVEALRDGWTWLGLEPERTTVGRAMAAAGLPPSSVITNHFVVIDGMRRVAQEVTDGLNAVEAAARLASGNLIAHPEDWDDQGTVVLIDAAWMVLSQLRREPGAKAVALARFPGVEAALLIVGDAAKQRPPVAGPFTLISCSPAAAAATLREVAASMVLPLWDPQRLFQGV